MVYNVIFWTNIFLKNEGIHATQSPRTRITRLSIDHNKHSKLKFDQVHKLAVVAEKYQGIIFMDMDGNILSDQPTDDDTTTLYQDDHSTMSGENTEVHNNITRQGKNNKTLQHEEEAIVPDQ